MKCALCKTPTQLKPGAGEFKRVKCPRCGEYQISNAALEVLKASLEMSYEVDIPAQRSWLCEKRRRGRTVPAIGSRELKLVRRQSHVGRAG